MKKLPIGIQSIREILEKGLLYVDKTLFALQLIESGKHYFLSRPRRFGKSLFLNTLEEIFRGNKELFRSCAIYNSSYPWKHHPIVYLDFAQIESKTAEDLENDLKDKLQEIAASYDVAIEGPSLQSQLRKLIAAIGQESRVVFLVDEYDSPIINHLKNPTIAEKNRDLLRNFFSTLKSLDRYLEFTFITGISKFSHVSLFSGLNNLNDITMDPQYGAIMGYTEEEVLHYFSEYVETIASEKGKEKEDILSEIKLWYNGYRFSKETLSVYNPFSTLNFMNKKEVAGYWYSTGTPTFLIDELKKHEESMISLDGATAREDELMDISSLEEVDLKALMYQTGYFTLQGYHPGSNRYQLGLPNKEVRTAFLNSLVKHFTHTIEVKSSEPFLTALQNHAVEVLFEHLNQGFARFPYQVFAQAKERTYQGMLLAMLYGMGFDPISERATNLGRIDVVLDLPKITYILELKLDSKPEKGLKQIREKDYFAPYLHQGKEVAILGASFCSEKRNISHWKGEILSENGAVIKTF